LGNENIFNNWDEVDPLDFSFFHWVPSIVVRKMRLQPGQPLSVRVELKWPGTAIYGDPNGVPITSAGLGWATLEAPANLVTYDAVVITPGSAVFSIFEGRFPLVSLRSGLAASLLGDQRSLVLITAV
jgi:hypothetical protein